MKMRNFPEARKEIQRAIALTKNLREQELLMEKLKQIEEAAPHSSDLDTRLRG
jgi:predicted RNA polymerase sigma factor